MAGNYHQTQRTTQSWRARRCAAAMGRVQASPRPDGTQQQEQIDELKEKDGVVQNQGKNNKNRKNKGKGKGKPNRKMEVPEPKTDQDQVLTEQAEIGSEQAEIGSERSELRDFNDPNNEVKVELNTLPAQQGKNKKNYDV